MNEDLERARQAYIAARFSPERMEKVRALTGEWIAQAHAAAEQGRAFSAIPLVAGRASDLEDQAIDHMRYLGYRVKVSKWIVLNGWAT